MKILVCLPENRGKKNKEQIIIKFKMINKSFSSIPKKKEEKKLVHKEKQQNVCTTKSTLFERKENNPEPYC